MAEEKPGKAEYEAWVAADQRFQGLLVEQFGKDAGDRRYDATRKGWSPATVTAAEDFAAKGKIAREALGWT